MDKITKSNIVDSNKGFKINSKDFKIPEPLVITKSVEKRNDSLSIWRIVWFLVKQSPTIIKIIYYIIRIFNMKDESKTTKLAKQKLVTLIMGAIASIVGFFGFDIPVDFITAFGTIIVLVWGWLDHKQGVATKDAE